MTPFAPSFVTGAVSAGLYFIVSAFGLGFLFLFLPTLPIFWLGFSNRSQEALLASLVGALLVALISMSVGVVALYFLCLALPAWFIAKEALKRGTHGPVVIWFPITVIFAQLMAGFCFALLAVTLYYADNNGGLPGLIAPTITQAFSTFSAEMDDTTGDMLRTAAPTFSFLIFSVGAWMWALCLYLHGWIVNRELSRQKIAVRPHLDMAAFPPPNWMISLILLAAMASLIGGPSLAFWGKSSLIALLFPYFLLGMAIVHAQAKPMEYRFLLLFLLYFMIVLLLWPVFILASIGFFYHIRLLNKYLSAGGTSSRS